MRVLIIHPDMSLYGGAELVIVKLANYLTRKGIENAVLTLSISTKIKKDLRGTRIITPKKKITDWRNLIAIILMLRKYVGKNLNYFDIINVHNFPAELSVFPRRKPTVWMCNEPPLEFAFPPTPSFPARVLRSIVIPLDKFVVKNYVNHVCVADDFNAKRFKKLYGITAFVNNYGIDYEFFSDGDGKKARDMFNLSRDDFILLQVGMLTPLKNQLESIKAVRNLKSKIPNAKLILVGHGVAKYEQMLREYVHNFELEEHVIFTGHLPRTVVRDLYAACDAALFPIKPQGGWLSPFEALCAARPIVVSTRMTAADIIKKNKIGIVTNDFTGVVLGIYNNPEKYRKMAKHGRTWVKENLSWDKFCQRMLEIFQEALKGDKSAIRN